jgi:hypothetical protein
MIHEHWEIKLSFRDIKSAIQHTEMTLRRKIVDLVYRELWGVPLAYNFDRREATRKAAIEQGPIRLPSGISFKFAPQLSAAQLVVKSGAVSQGRTLRRFAENLEARLACLSKKRTRPPIPRTVKISKTRSRDPRRP